MIKGVYMIGDLEFLHSHKGSSGNIEVTAWRGDKWIGDIALLCRNDLTEYVHRCHQLYKLLEKEGHLERGQTK